MVFVVFYTYTGYGMLLYVLVRIKRLRGKGKSPAETDNYEPEVTLFIAAYNEQDVIVEKMQNCLDLEYPREKLHISWVTDGSDDGTLELLSRYEGIEVHHSPQRNGKIGAMNRGMKFVKTPIVVFSDANTMLSRNAVRRITAKFRNPVVGCVSGEKKDLQQGQGERGRCRGGDILEI